MMPGQALQEKYQKASVMRRLLNLAAQYELWFALILIFLSMLRASILPWVVIGLGVLSLLRLLAQKRWSVSTPVNWLMLVLAITSLISIWISPLPEVTAPQVFRLLTGLALFFAVANWLTRSERVGMMVIGATCLPPAYAVLSMFAVEWPTGKVPLIPASLYNSFSILVKDTIHPNVLAGNLVVFLPLSFALLLYRWDDASIKPAFRFLLRILLAASLLFSTFILLLTQSRGAWLAFGFACILITILRFRWGWLAVLLAGVGSLITALYFLDLSWWKRWLYSSYMIGDLASRIELWARGIFMLEDFFFTGIGMGTFAQTTDALYPLRGAAPPHVHNLFLQVGVDLGVPGLLAWFAIYLLITWAAWRIYSWKNSRYPWTRYLGAGMLGSQAVLALHGLFDAVTWGMIRPAPLVWGWWGLCLGAYLVISSEQAEGA